MDGTTTKPATIPVELRRAANALRCDHAFPCYPPTGTLRQPGPCRHCGLPRLVVADEVPENLREPLAALLDEIARQYDMPPCDKPDGACNGCERRDDFVYANGLAQIINGSTA